MNTGAQPLTSEARTALLAQANMLRPELHRYCARLMGSIIEGEDVVQDALVRAVVALQDLHEAPALRPWLFRIAHNRALDLLRSRQTRAAEPIETASEVADTASPDPTEVLMRREAVETAISRFLQLGVSQRSIVILKDVLDEPLSEIAALLDLSIDAVKGHLARGRVRLQQVNAQAAAPPILGPSSAAVAHFVELFNQRDWDGLRALLADDVKLVQASHPARAGRARVGAFFTTYAKIGAVRLVPAWLEGQEIIAVFEGGAGPSASYLMWLEWSGNRISFIHDYRYARYVVAEAKLAFAQGARAERPST